MHLEKGLKRGSGHMTSDWSLVFLYFSQFPTAVYYSILDTQWETVLLLLDLTNFVAARSSRAS